MNFFKRIFNPEPIVSIFDLAAINPRVEDYAFLNQLSEKNKTIFELIMVEMQEDLRRTLKKAQANGEVDFLLCNLVEYSDKFVKKITEDELDFNEFNPNICPKLMIVDFTLKPHVSREYMLYNRGPYDFYLSKK